MRADAIVLAGGRASRMGGVDKPSIVIAGRSMLQTALAAVRACRRTVVVGAYRPELPAAIVQTQEDPPGSGPVAAVAAGLDRLEPDGTHVVIIAADLPFLTASTIDALLRRADTDESDAMFAIDESGRPQYLLGVWRRDALLATLAGLDSPANQPMRVLVPKRTTTLQLDGIEDCDTPDDVLRAETMAAEPLTLTRARDVCRNELTPLPATYLALSEAMGATLAEPLVAAEAMPRFDVSAMDGYAIRDDGPWRLREDIGYAGGARPHGLLPGEAVRIATGAHMPDGATAVLRDEDAVVRDDALDRAPGAAPRNDVRRRGEEWLVGAPIADAGAAVGPALVSVAAGLEATQASVRGPLRAHLVLTGDEIRRSGPLRDGQTRDTIGPVLPIYLSACGIRTDSSSHLRDTAHGFDELFGTATESDLLVIVGATGGGAADQLRGALGRCGARMLVTALHCRPGGSTLVAELPDGRTVLGLPGNPYAALALGLALGPAIVAGRTRRTPMPAMSARIANAGEAGGEVTRIAPARQGADGEWTVQSRVHTAHLGGLLDTPVLAIIEPGMRDNDRAELLPLHR